MLIIIGSFDEVLQEKNKFKKELGGFATINKRYPKKVQKFRINSLKKLFLDINGKSWDFKRPYEK